MITDLDGKFYQGSKTIEVPGYGDIVDFIDEHDMALRDYDQNTDNGSKVVRFENFVQPNLWQAFYSGDFFKTKTLERRLNEESKYHRNVANRIKGRLGEEGEIEKVDYQKPCPGRKVDTIPKKIQTLQVEADTSDFVGTYPTIEPTLKGFQEATKKANEISYSILPRLRFNTRAVEMAFFENGGNGELNPGWPVPQTEMGYKQKGKRI